MNTIALLGLAVGSGLLLFGYKIIRNDGNTPKPEEEGEEGRVKNYENGVLIPSDRQREEEQKHTLEVYSDLWKKNENQKNTLKELANIWRTDVDKGSLEAPDKPLFLHREIKLFYKDHVDGKPFFVGAPLNATVELLKLLDVRGKCPSVVNKHKEEPERGYDQHVYEVLKKITLFEHTTNVAREILKLVPPATPMVPKAVIAALAHDLGKITLFYDKLHGTGVHAFVGISVLDKLPSLQKLKFYSEIVDAVKNHHRNPEGAIGKALKIADQEARRKEVTDYATEELANELMSNIRAGEEVGKKTREEKGKKRKTEAPAQQKPANVDLDADALSDIEEESTPKEQALQPPAKKPAKAPASQPKRSISDLSAGIDTESTPADLFGSNSSTPLPKEVDLMGAGSEEDSRKNRNIRKIKIPWFDATAALELMFPAISQNTRWTAVSMPEGTIYVRPDLLFSVANSLSNNAPDIQVARGDEESKASVIYAMVNAFREVGAIETTMVSEKFYGAQFIINPGQQNTYEAYLIPFKSEAWKKDISIFELRKNTELKKITAITPKYVEESL